MAVRNHPGLMPLRLDLANEWVWQGERCLQLPPKAFAVLRYLVEHPSRLVSKAELLRAVWPDTVVSEWALTTCLREVRKALREKAQAPRYIETVHRRGYRFIGAVAAAAAPVSNCKLRVPSSDTQDSALRTQPSVVVGREAELEQLHNWLDKALGGERQLVFVTGEPGIGKTTLVEAFLEQQVAADGNVWIGQGQCVEHYGTGEVYMPVLEALGRLCRGPGGERLTALLNQHAPTWLVQMPALLDAAELESVQRKTAGATRERMLRELAEALEALTPEQPLVLWLEDLHWSDAATLEWLAFVARRRERARVLIVGTYRPVEMLAEDHPLQRVLHELYAHQLAQELRLRRLSEREVSNYLALRFPQSVFPTRLAEVLQQRTDGNPLFLTSLVQELLIRQVLRQADDGRWEFHGTLAELERWTPESVRHVLTHQRERLAREEQRVLEAASLAGLEFSAAAVAAALETEAIQVEAHCGRLVEQQQFLRLAGISEWPDGTRAGRYGFLHALYQEFWHERVSVGHQQQWHLRMGERKEAAYGRRAREIATELAVHFEQGRDYRKAVQYLQQAGENALRCLAHQAAVHLIRKGLELLPTLPDTPDRAQQELRLQLTLAAPLTATAGYTALEVERVHTRALELCRQVGETPQLFSTLLGLCGFYLERAEIQKARECAEQGLSLAQNVHDPVLLMWAHRMMGDLFYRLGEFALTREHLEQGIALYHSQSHRASGVLDDPAVYCLSFTAYALWFLGYPDQALQRSEEALTLAQEIARPFSVAFALDLASVLHRVRREGRAAQEQAEAAIALSREQGFPFFLTLGIIQRAWALIEQEQVEEGIIQLRQGMAAWRALRTELSWPTFLALLAEGYRKVGQAEEGLPLLAEALATIDRTGERYFEAELYRLKGELVLQSTVHSPQSDNPNTQHLTPSPHTEAEGCFHKAIEIARRQQAKSLELRAVMSLARLWQRQGKKEGAHKMLAEIYDWFTEGFDTKDLQEAKALLEELQH
jgi:predicted ATPase/DNA-binding winged helix-turn-helix (wHTH) protein